MVAGSFHLKCSGRHFGSFGLRSDRFGQLHFDSSDQHFGSLGREYVGCDQILVGSFGRFHFGYFGQRYWFHDDAESGRELRPALHVVSNAYNSLTDSQGRWRCGDH